MLWDIALIVLSNLLVSLERTKLDWCERLMIELAYYYHCSL